MSHLLPTPLIIVSLVQFSLLESMLFSKNIRNTYNNNFVLFSLFYILTTVTESRSRTKTAVSSAYRETLISFSPTLMPLMAVSFLIAFASNSMPITNSSPDKGQLCLTPRSKWKNSDANPLFRTQLETLLLILNAGSEIE